MTEMRSGLSTLSKKILSTGEIAVFAVLGAIMFCSKILMDALPNIHLIGTLTVAYTVVYRKKALIPVYVFVFLTGLYGGFNMWWIPYLYIWMLLWGMAMLVPKKLPRKAKIVVYPAVSCLHGLLYGILYAPAQALMMKMSFRSTVAWIVAGFPFDAMHAVGNLVLGFLILPLSDLLRKLTAQIVPKSKN